MLTHNPRLAHHATAPAKSSAPDWRLVTVKGDNARAKACFLLSKYQHTLSMVGLVVELLTKRRDPLTPVRQSAISLTTQRLASFGGDLKSLSKEIASMAINVHTRLKTFIFAAVERENLNSSRPVEGITDSYIRETLLPLSSSGQSVRLNPVGEPIGATSDSLQA